MRQIYSSGSRKAAVIGAGYVGSTIAYTLALGDIAREIVLIDIDTAKAEGEAMDIRHGIPAMGTADVYAGSYADCAGCDLIIITAGRGRKPGETRRDLTQENVRIMQNVTDSIRQHYTGGVILIISNPVDILTAKVTEWMGLPDGMVFSSGCMLDSSRFVRCIADHVGLGTGVIGAYVAGEHGDAQVPVWSRVTVSGIPIGDYCTELHIPWNAQIREEIAAQTKCMGAQIIQAKGRTHYGIAACVRHLADAIINYKPSLVSVSSVLHGEYDCEGIALSVPSVVGPGGVQQRIREPWTPEELAAFRSAAQAIRETMQDAAL